MGLGLTTLDVVSSASNPSTMPSMSTTSENCLSCRPFDLVLNDGFGLGSTGLLLPEAFIV